MTSQKDMVRIHSSSGSTNKPIIIPYSQTDVNDWVAMLKRCYLLANVTENDIIQNTPGYGLWTAGIGFQMAAESLGAMTVPTGPGNTERQIQFFRELKTTVLCATCSYALFLAEEIAKQKIKDINLKKVIVGSEYCGSKMRKKICENLNVELYDIYGLTEIYGPGIGMSCKGEQGIHYWDDYLYFEIIDPDTGQNVPDGKYGELVITTLKKEAYPLIRYRTHDITKILPRSICSCGSKFPKISTILGRTDDIYKCRGVKVSINTIESILEAIDEVTSEYLIVFDNNKGRDIMTLIVEADHIDENYLSNHIKKCVKNKLEISPHVVIVLPGTLPRTSGKSKRIIDNRIY